jgi:hypothetical protein
MDLHGVGAGLLSLLIAGCGAARPQLSRKLPAAVQSAQPSAACDRARALEGSAYDAAKAGSLLRARRLAEQAEQLCPSATQVLGHVQDELQAATGAASELLAAGVAARAEGDLIRARRSESLAVALLERQRGARLSLVQRWSAKFQSTMEHGPFLTSMLDGQLLVMDGRTGKLHARVPLTPKLARVGLSPSGDRLLLHGIDLSAAYQPPPACASTLDLFDARNSKWLKRECAMDWTFSPDSSRLVVSRLAPSGDGTLLTGVVVLDSKTLEPVIELPDSGSVQEFRILPDGNTLLVNWSNQVSVTDLVSGKTEFFSGAKQESSSNLAFGGTLVAWRSGGVASVWSSRSRLRSSFELGPCADNLYGNVALSPSGAQLATECGDVVTIWQLATGVAGSPTKTLQLPAPPHHALFFVEWLPNERGLIVHLSKDSHEETALYDLKRRSWVPFVGADERVVAIDASSHLVIVERKKDRVRRLLHLDAALLAKAVPLPPCSPTEIVSTGDSSAILTCWTGGAAVLLDITFLPTRSSPSPFCRPIVSSDTLISTCFERLELRDLKTGAISAHSPVVPAPTAFEGWWDGTAFLSRISLGDSEVRRVVHFGDTLRSETEAWPSDEACDQYRGKAAWSSSPPYSICDRRSGTVIGRIPSAALSPSQFASPGLSDDGKLVLSSPNETPLLAHVADAHAVSLADLPRNVSFVGPDLLVGSGEDSDWGFWSAATGQRLSHSTASLTQMPILADPRLGIAIEPGRPPTLRDFASGEKLGHIAAEQRGELQLSSRGVLSVVETSRISFWQLPHTRRLGLLLNHPETGEVAFLTDKQGFEVSGDPTQWRELLRCQVGLEELPLELCIDALLQPGIGAQTLLAN